MSEPTDEQVEAVARKIDPHAWHDYGDADLPRLMRTTLESRQQHAKAKAKDIINAYEAVRVERPEG